MAARKQKQPPLTRYLVRPGAHLSQKDADILGPAIQRCIDSGATNTARALLDAASGSSSEARKLRKYFEWNDSKAAHQHRITQARTYISSIQIEVVVRKTAVRTPAFVPTYRNKGEYTDIGTAVQHEDIVESLLRESLQQLKAWHRRFAMLRQRAELADLFAVIDHVLLEELPLPTIRR